MSVHLALLGLEDGAHEPAREEAQSDRYKREWFTLFLIAAFPHELPGTS